MMLLTLYAVCALIGGALTLWRSPRMPRYSLLLAIAAVPQLGAVFGIWIPGMFLVSVATIGIWCMSNQAVAGVPVVSLGMILNFLPMAFHGGAMPISSSIVTRIGYAVVPGTLLVGSKDVVVGPTPLALLSDWIVIPSSATTIVASPGDIVVVIGIMWWLLFSHREERNQPMMTLRTVPTGLDHHARLLPGQSARPDLTRLALLAAANPTVAESLLRDPLDAAHAHPHYTMTLDARDRATLVDIRSRVQTVGEFLAGLADVVDGATV